MTETNWQKFMRHWKTGGPFYAIYRGIKYLSWRSRCRRTGVDWKKFSQLK